MSSCLRKPSNNFVLLATSTDGALARSSHRVLNEGRKAQCMSALSLFWERRRQAPQGPAWAGASKSRKRRQVLCVASRSRQLVRGAG